MDPCLFFSGLFLVGLLVLGIGLPIAILADRAEDFSKRCRDITEECDKIAEELKAIRTAVREVRDELRKMYS